MGSYLSMLHTIPESVTFFSVFTPVLYPFLCVFFVKKMVNQCLNFEYGSQDTSGRNNERTTTRRWVSWRPGGTPTRKRVRACRKRKTKRMRQIDNAVVIARRAAAAGHSQCSNHSDLRIRARHVALCSKTVQVGNEVWYIPVGPGKSTLKVGNVDSIYSSGLKSKWGGTFIIVERCRKEREANRRVSRFVAVAPKNVFVRK